ncbi:MAG: hypothetical protein ACM3PW_04270 [Chlamydiota bacterium]
MADPSAKNLGIAGIFIILLLLAGLMLTGLLTYLAWHTSAHGPSGQLFIAPPSRSLHAAPAILFGEPPIPQAKRQVREL